MVGSQLILTLRLWEMLPVPQIPNIRRGGAVWGQGENPVFRITEKVCTFE